jgi:septum formation protein
MKISSSLADGNRGFEQTRPLILGSTSAPRRELLSRLGVPFEVVPPEVDETPLPGEDSEALPMRLALAKASAVAAARGRGVIIGSDQIGLLEGRVVGKPGTHERALAQLLAASGRTMHFLSAVCVIDAESGRKQQAQVTTTVRFRHFDAAFAEVYLHRDQPYACAGAFKSESLGVLLIDAMESEDPTAILGMPLIRVARMLENEGVVVFGN